MQDHPVNTIVVQGKKVAYFCDGAGENSCLFIGAGSIYFPQLDPHFKRLYTFHSADPHFTLSPLSDPISEKEIASLEIQNFVNYYEELRKVLGLQKVAVFGPSTLGSFIAHAYGQAYPENVSHIILLGTVSSTHQLRDKQHNFMLANYGNPRLATSQSWQKWERYSNAQEQYNRTANSRTLEEDFIEEVSADIEKYVENNTVSTEELKTSLRSSWGDFNPRIRSHFFKKASQHYAITGESKVPTLAILGIYDGISPCYDLLDRIISGEIKNIDYIIEEEAHFLFSKTVASHIASWVKNHPIIKYMEEEKQDFLPIVSKL